MMLDQIILDWKITHLFIVCVGVGVGAHMPQCLCGGQKTTCSSSVLAFYYVGSRNWNQVVKLEASSFSCSLSHLVGLFYFPDLLGQCSKTSLSPTCSWREISFFPNCYNPLCQEEMREAEPKAQHDTHWSCSVFWLTQSPEASCLASSTQHILLEW